MGFANAEETDVNVEMTSKPKERQFQVVPVPGVFTRGRWKCWDYRDEPVVEDKILNYSDKTDKLSSSAVPAASDANLTMLDVSPVVQPLSHIHSEPYLSTDASSVATATVVLPGSASVSETGLLPTGKESSTIVVTSVAPASVTPIQVTSRSATVPTSPEPLVSSTIHIPIVSSTLTILSEGEAQRSTSLPISPSLAQSGTTATISLGSVSPQAGPCTTFVSPSTASVASGVSSGSIVSCPASAAVSQPSRQNASSPVLSRQTSLASFSESAVASMPILSPIESVLEDANVMGGATSGPNVVAIDNKIEQAMDLVKTHLTFAVREEVEILRSAIVELEAKVSQLESQNQLLRQFAPAEVLANLGYYIQKKKEAQGSVTSVSASVTFQTLPVSVQPISSSTSQTLVMQPQTVPSNVAAVAPTIATQHAAVSSQTVAVQQTPTSLQQSMSVSAPSLANQHAASLLQSSLSQQVTALPQQQTILQGTVQQQTLSVQKPLGPQPSASASTQVSTVVQQNVATKHLGNVAVATLPIGSEVIMQQPATVVTNAAAQLHYADPNDPKSAVM